MAVGGNDGYGTILHKMSQYNTVLKRLAVFDNYMLLLALSTV